jgi:ankyrin repeat protein
LSAGASVNVSDENGITPLMTSLGQGDDKVTKDLLYIGNADINAVDESGNNVLKYSFVSPASRKLLLAMDKAVPIKRKQDTMTILLEGSRSKNSNQEEEEEEASTNTGSTIVDGNDRNMLQLLQNGADVTACDSDGNYPLHWLGRGVSIHFQFKGKTVMLRNNVKTDIESQERGYQVSRGKQLLDKGASSSINGCNKFGQTPLHVALASGLTPLALLLIKNGASPNIVDVHNNLPLHLACTGWSKDVLPVIQLLINNGKGKRIIKGIFNPNDVALGLNFSQRETERVERILTCSFTKHVSAPPSILSKQVSLKELLNYSNNKGHGPFHVVCGSCGNTEHYSNDNKNDGPLGPHTLPITSTSTNEASSTSMNDSGGMTMKLLQDHKIERSKILEYLLSLHTKNGQRIIDPNFRSMPNGLTGLHYLARSSTTYGDPHIDERMVDLIINAGADVNAVDAQTRAGGGGPRYAPLHYAIQKSPELAWHLLRVDGALSHPATANPPALLLACEQGVEADMIGYLVTHGEDANITGSGVYKGHRKYCGTGLQLASEQGHDHIVAALVLSLPNKINVNFVRPHNGRSALHLASFRGHLDVVKHLVEDGYANKYLLDNNGEVSSIFFLIVIIFLSF